MHLLDSIGVALASTGFEFARRAYQGLSRFGGGEYPVGMAEGMLAPGVYSATVPADSTGCFWEQRSTIGTVRSGWADSYASVQVVIDEETVTFRTTQCGIWKRK